MYSLYNRRYDGGNKTRSYLIFAFEHEHVGDFSERNAQMYDLGFGDLIGYIAYVYHPGRLVVGGLVEFHLEILVFVILKHTDLQKGISGVSRQPHALAAAISRTADKRPGEFNLRPKGAATVHRQRRMVWDGMWWDGWMGRAWLSSYYIYRISLG